MFLGFVTLGDTLNVAILTRSGDAPTDKEAKMEIGHYALMYGQDGPVEIRKAR